MKWLRSLSARTWMIIAAVLVVLVVAVGAIWWQYRDSGDGETTELVRSDACKVEHIERFVDAIDTQDLSELADLRDDIEQLDNYDGSANCQYILVRESIATGQIEQAETEFTLLKRLAPNEYELSPEFGSTAITYDAIRDAIDTLEVNQTLTDEEKQFWGGEGE